MRDERVIARRGIGILRYSSNSAPALLAVQQACVKLRRQATTFDDDQTAARSERDRSGFGAFNGVSRSARPGFSIQRAGCDRIEAENRQLCARSPALRLMRRQRR